MPSSIEIQGNQQLKSGILYKKDDVIQSWSRVDIMINGSMLVYSYKAIKEESIPTESILLTGCSIELFDIHEELDPKQELKSIGIRINLNKQKNYSFACEDQQDAKEWISSLIQASKRDILPLNVNTILSFQEYHSMHSYEKSLECNLEEFRHYLLDDTWELQFEKNGFKGEIKILNGIPASRSSGFIKATPRTLWKIITTLEYKSKYDKNFEKEKVIEKLDEQCIISNLKYSGIWPVSGRDFCVLLHWRVTKENRILFTGKSIEHEKCPPHSKYVRANAILGGWQLIPHNDGTFVTYIGQANMKGNLPDAVANYVSTQQCNMVQNLSKFVTEYLKTNPNDSTPVTNLCVK